MTTAATEAPTTHSLLFKGTHNAGLVRALTNALLFAGTEPIPPALTCVRFEFDGSQLELVATDRYRLSFEVVEYDTEAVTAAGVPPFAFLLERPFVTALIAQLKRDKLLPFSIDYHEASGKVQISTFESTAEFRTYTDGSFPAWRRLIPADDTRQAVDEIGFTYPFLADLGKVKTPEKAKYVQIRTYGKTKPVRVDYRGGPTVILIPIRLDEGTQWGASSS